ncbi:MBL fold metallo-hydrolase [Collimonas sp.]|uniref:MBL fold metallo-hydrolase n=1 Tax=Collimonas sp. TaxID=1963772 RepID=UPI002C99DE94|nr:MBL fold metallo-hydrolase [Collimonas sp.]HWX00421.1 MBL fold metallo-hydrolase [Collimonas sp.]
MRKSSIIRLSAAVLLLAGLWVAYTQGPPPAKLDLIKVKDDLYVIHNDIVPGNSTALITSEGVLLVDDKFDVDHNGILEQLKKVTDQPIKYVVNTHHHADHSGGNAKMQDMNAIVVATEEARQNMVDGKQPGLPGIADPASRAHLSGRQERGDVSLRARSHQWRHGGLVSGRSYAGGGRHVHLRRRHSPTNRLRRRGQRQRMAQNARIRAGTSTLTPWFQATA